MSWGFGGVDCRRSLIHLAGKTILRDMCIELGGKTAAIFSVVFCDRCGNMCIESGVKMAAIFSIVFVTV